MAEETTSDSPKKSNSPLRSIILVVGMLVVEAVFIVGAMMMVGGPPEVQAGDALSNVEVPLEDKIVEVLVLDARLANNMSGATYVYDAQIYVQARQRHADPVSAEIEQFRNEIHAEITAIWRSSDPRHFQESSLETLTRKVHALLGQRFGNDPVSGDPIIEKAVIVMSTGFRIDS